MVSQLSWLDSSPAEQQRVREMLNMFSEQESRDELGIGQVRDAFSDLLFPGTSTLHTRARYLLIVPWCIRHAGRRADRDQAVQLDRVERGVISALQAAGATDGLIGRRASTGVKTLPSTIYASALRRYGIDNGIELTSTPDDPDVAELTDLRAGRWPATLPQPPAGFPETVGTGLDLTPWEADWLRERIATSTSGSLLAHLLQVGNRPEDEAAAPWLVSAAGTAPQRLRRDLEHARGFSTCLHGAALLYNLILAEQYDQAGHDRVEPPDYREALAEWAERVSTVGPWDRADMWRRVVAVNPRIKTNLRTQAFIEAWLDLVLAGRAAGAADDEQLRDLVIRREKAVKKTQSRLTNGKLLRSWTGASGSRQLVYRWPQVRRLLTDIHTGMEATGAAAA
ncbi:DUF6361 family protein [Micromonospora sp. NPDC002717]|uniref:DUF6361 family protein n=1 Tax=Micromonospora sp. NPDC002717 TaxID=3154424 RepID=UPI003333A70E